MTKYVGTFYGLETENGIVKTNLRETPKLKCQEGYLKKEDYCKDDVATLISDLLAEGVISSETFLNFIDRYPDEQL